MEPRSMSPEEEALDALSSASSQPELEMEDGRLLSGGLQPTRSLFAKSRTRWAPAGIATVLALGLFALVLLSSEDGQPAPMPRDGTVRKVEVKKKQEKTKGDKVVPDQGMGWVREGGPYWPTLFCWSVMNCKNVNEVATIKGQLRNHSGIFTCDNAAVISAERMLLGDGHKLENGSFVPVYTWKNPAHTVAMGNLQGGDHTNSFKNTDIFINAWDILVKSGALWGHDWIAKVDPDAVFFAHRLRAQVKPYTFGENAKYLKNCNSWGKDRLYGSLEVFNEKAMKLYEANAQNCKQLPWGGWGEDEWIDTCMQNNGAQAITDLKLVGDKRCEAAQCDTADRVAYHDYKTEESYYNCFVQSVEAEKVASEGFFCCLYGADCNGCTQRQWPGSDYCGESKAHCSGCGNTKWCRMVSKNKAVSA